MDESEISSIDSHQMDSQKEYFDNFNDLVNMQSYSFKNPEKPGELTKLDYIQTYRANKKRNQLVLEFFKLKMVRVKYFFQDK